MTNQDIADKAKSLATGLTELVGEVTTAGVQLDHHDAFYAGYVASMLVKLADAFGVSAPEDRS